MKKVTYLKIISVSLALHHAINARKEYAFSIHARNPAKFAIKLHHVKDVFQDIISILLTVSNVIHDAEPVTVKTCVYLALNLKFLEMVTAVTRTVSYAIMKNAGLA